MSYGLLRYLGSPAIRARLSDLQPAEMSFNYLGQLDQALPDSQLFAPAAENAGPRHGAQAQRHYKLSILGSIAQGRLQTTWNYSESLHRRETIEAFADRFVAALRDLIAHCLSPTAGGYSPSDFPLAEVDQESLEHALDEVEL